MFISVRVRVPAKSKNRAILPNNFGRIFTEDQADFGLSSLVTLIRTEKRPENFINRLTIVFFVRYQPRRLQECIYLLAILLKSPKTFSRSNLC